jgi:hypothetical protein
MTADSALFWGLSSTGWMAVFTVVIALAAVVQALIYGLMLSTSRQIERAYVNMSHYPPGLTFGFEFSSSTDPIWKQDVAVRMKVCNHGNTPARITRALIQPIVAVEPLPDKPQYDETFGEHIDAVLVKDDHIDIPKPMRIQRSDLATIKSLGNNVAECIHPLRLFIIGYVDYIDRFGTRHRSGYARVYNHWVESKGIQPDDPTVTSQSELEERHKRRNNLVFLSQSGYNYDRKRKQNEGKDWDEITSDSITRSEAFTPAGQ